MAPPQESSGSFRQQSAAYATEPKRMRLSSSVRSTAAAAGSSTTTRASTGAPTAMTNKGSVYKAQRGRGERDQCRHVDPCFNTAVAAAALQRCSLQRGGTAEVVPSFGLLARRISGRGDRGEKLPAADSNRRLSFPLDFANPLLFSENTRRAVKSVAFPFCC